jgi:hypothetical protein
MSNIRDLFSKKLHVSKVDVDKAEVESKEYITEKKIEREQFVPPIDFASASNYVRFGSAKEYYANSIKRIYNTYPYDGSETEKLEFRNDSTELDKWMFDSKYPKASGHAVFDADSHIVVNRGYKEATVPASFKLSKLFDLKSVKHNEEERRKETVSLDFDDGITLEWWMKRDTKAEKEALFYFSSSNGSYIQLSVRTADSDINGIQLQMYEVGSTSYGVNDKDIISHSDLDQSALIDNTWHHHAFSLAKVDGTLYADYYYDGLHRKETTIPGSWQNITGSVTLFIASGSFISDSLSIGFP